MEVCADSVASAINAERGGATRVELCADLMEGGTTPSVGLLRVVKERVKLPVFVMVRPRGGDFLYNEDELSVMTEDVSALKEAGADGIVFGILKTDGTVDVERCREIIDLARPLPVTFHRAIDMSRDIGSALEHVIELGCSRVLTSGGESSALEGLPVLRYLVQKAEGRIIVMPGGGINERNLVRILEGCKATEFHCSARSPQQSSMSYRKSGISMGASLSPMEYSIKTADKSRVENIVAIANNYWKNDLDI